MGSTPASQTAELLHRVATSVERGLDKNFQDNIDAALMVMDKPKKYSVTSRSGRSWQPKAVQQDVKFGLGRMAKLKFRPAAPAYWTEYGTHPHWVYPHGRARTRSVYSPKNRYAGRTRRGRAGGAKALKTGGGEFYANVFVSGVRPHPFWKSTRKAAVKAAVKETKKHTIQNVLKAGFGR